jgi:peptidoglycan/LPS O-acetylase OafA/YrhL
VNGDGTKAQALSRKANNISTGSPEPPKSLKWLNSTRALGVVLVLVYHFFPDLLPGGFIGVDIFFVVSGYLITSLLIREYEESGRLQLSAFYWRRWRRLFPALMTTLLVCLPLLLLISPDFRVGIVQQSAAALSWTTNYYEIVTGQSYEAQLLPHLFIHTWTLSIEMQYYLAWGLLVLVVFALSRAFPKLSPRLCIIVLTTIITIASAYLMWTLAAGVDDPSVAYMSTPSHIFPLMIGSLFGALGGFAPIAARAGVLAQLQAGKGFFKPVSLVLIVAGLIVILLISFTFSFSDPRTYQFGILVVALITGIILYLARFWQNLSPGREWVISDYIGIRSYSIYLFHWPLMIVATEVALGFNMEPDTAELIAAAIGIPLTFILSELSYRFVEQPFRVKRARPGDALVATRRRPGKAKRQARATAYALSASILLALSLVVVVGAPRITSIETDLRKGALEISVSDVESAYDELMSAGSEDEQ